MASTIRNGYATCILLLMMATLIFSTVECTESNLTITRRETIDEIKVGLEAGQLIGQFLTSKEVRSGLLKMAVNVTPYLGIIGSFFALFLDSTETAYMKEMMKNIDNRFDQIDYRLNDIQRMIDWTSVKINYGQLENHIKALSTNLKTVYEVPSQSGRKSAADVFKSNFKNNYDNSGLKLYNAIIQSGSVFQENLAVAMVKYTKYDLPKTELMLRGIVRLLVQAARLELASAQLNNQKDYGKHMAGVWDERIKKVIGKTFFFEKTIKSRYHQQSGEDFDEMMVKYSPSQLNHEDFKNKLYKHLTRKYYWRDWLVVVYDQLSGGTQHAVNICAGHKRFGKNGRNAFIANVDKWSPIVKPSTDKRVNSVKPMIPHLLIRFLAKAPFICCNAVLGSWGHMAYGYQPKRMSLNQKYYYHFFQWA